MADFSNFELHDNVGELADGLIPEMAKVFEVELGQKPSEQELGSLVGAIGTSKVLQQNIGQVQEKLGVDEQAVTIAANWLGRSGVQKALDRSLWTVESPTPDYVPIILTGAVANWQDRAAKLVAKTPNDEIYLPVGVRVMDTPTEVTNTRVEQFYELEGRYPTEAEYAETYVSQELRLAGKSVYLTPYDTISGTEIAERFVEENKSLFSSQVAFARVANAGIQLAGQFVRAARAAGVDFDKSRPQAYVITDTFQIATNSKEQDNPREYQNPFTGIRQIAVTAKEITALQA